MKRRQFLKQCAAGAAAAAFSVPTIIPRHVLGDTNTPAANDRIAIGAIGVGGRAKLLLDQLPEDGRIVALSDCNLPRAEEYRGQAGADWPIFQDYRELLDRRDIDAVIVGTGEFQRAIPCIHACQAGKDIYAEKPLTLYINEGRALVQAARKHDRVFQVGTQQRSMEVNRIACELVRTGGLGRIQEVRAINYTGAEATPATPFDAASVPQGLDWNQWLNQAAWRDYHPQWMGWMRWRDFAGGEMTNWGAHGVDQIQWALGADGTGPTRIRPLTDGPNGQILMTYADGLEVKFILENGRGPMGGAVFICERGKLEINRNKFTSNPPEIAEELRKKVDIVEQERKWSDALALWQARWHMQNWLDCIRTRQQPVADVEIGHRSVSVCHLANIARAVGRPLQWDPAKESFVGDAEANSFLERPRRKGFELPSV
ncbi:MAG: Gfo/Idh/MocA family oxidoreductase [Planctomycetales bacterium]|nr:Gfo/Idh/MocA family oxidoreductase [Planctomycetales bacterium]